MDRFYQVLRDETADYNLSAIKLDNPPARVLARYLVGVDRAWRYCSAELLLTLEPLDVIPVWDGDEPDSADDWHDLLNRDPAEPVTYSYRRVVKHDPCSPGWASDTEPDPDPAAPVVWALALEAAAYQGNYTDDDDADPDESEEERDRRRSEQAREDAQANHLV